MDSSQCCGLVVCASMLGCWLWAWPKCLWSQWKTFNFSEWAAEVFWGAFLCQPIWKYQWEQRRGEVQFPVSTEKREREFYFLLLFFKKHLPKDFMPVVTWENGLGLGYEMVMEREGLFAEWPHFVTLYLCGSSGCAAHHWYKCLVRYGLL